MGTTRERQLEPFYIASHFLPKISPISTTQQSQKGREGMPNSYQPENDANYCRKKAYKFAQLRVCPGLRKEDIFKIA